MRIRASIGLGIFLLVLSIAMPNVFSALEALLLSVMRTAQTTVEHAETLTASPSFLSLPVPTIDGLSSY